MLPASQNNHSDLVPPAVTKPRLTLSRGGLYRSSETRRAEHDLESAFRDAAAGAKRSTNSHAYPGPAIAALAQSLTVALARRIYALLLQNWKGGGGREFGERIGHAVLTCNAQLERKYGPHGTISRSNPSAHSHRTADKGAA